MLIKVADLDRVTDPFRVKHGGFDGAGLGFGRFG